MFHGNFEVVISELVVDSDRWSMFCASFFMPVYLTETRACKSLRRNGQKTKELFAEQWDWQEPDDRLSRKRVVTIKQNP